METTGIAHAAPVDLSFDSVRYAVNVQASAWTRLRAACCGARAGEHTRLDAAADGGEDGLDHGAPKEILHGITGYVEAGQCLAIMGPSGAGKSSLMDVLAGRQKRGTVDGNIYVNGRPPPANYQRLAGYVMQDDVLIGTLTVTETLMYSHALRMPKEVHVRDGAATVASILQILNLRKIANSRIGTPLKRGISGGERRRLNIGIEMVTSPSLLFLDEPTSGLDARNALRVMRAILRLCRVTGRTVVCTIHQPRSNVYAMFDRLLLLDRGHTVYFGPAATAMDYFGKLGFPCPQFANPADYLLDLLEDAVEGDTVPTTASSASLSTTLAAGRGGSRRAAGRNSNGGGDDDGDDDDDDDDSGGGKAELAAGAAGAAALGVDFPAAYRASEPAREARLWIDRQQEAMRTFVSSGSMAGKAPFRPTTAASLSVQALTVPPSSSSSAAATVASSDKAPLAAPSMRAYGAVDAAAVPAPSPTVGPTADGSGTGKYATSTWRQLSILTSRTWRSTVRDPAVMWVRTGAAVLIALLVGGIFFNQSPDESSAGNRTNVMLFVMCVFSLFCLPAIGKYIEDRALFIRERAGGFYSTFAYYTATFAVEFPILLGIVLLYGVISYWMVGLNPSADAFFLFLTIVFLVICVGFSLSQLIAASVSSLSMAIATYMIILVYSLLTGGFIVSKADLPQALQWLLYTSYFYYGYESLLIVEFGDKEWGPEFLDDFGFAAENLGRDMAVLAAMFVGYRIAAYIVLAYFLREKR